MINEQSINQFIQSELVSDRTEDNLSNTDNLIESGILDSLGIIKLITYLEESYSIKVTDEELSIENFETIEAISRFLRNKIN